MDPASLAMTVGGNAIDALTNVTSKAKPVAMNPAGARAAAQDFEAVFLQSMFSQMFTGIDGEGPFGGEGSSGVWRSFLTDEYSKTMAKSGGIGLADDVYRSLIAMQEANQ